MKTLVTIGVAAWLAQADLASAGVPGWCKDASFDDNYDLRALSSRDPGEVVIAFARAVCKPTDEAAARRGEIDRARQAWGKTLGMTEDDWADAVAYANVGGRPAGPELSTKDLATFTPIDQYRAIDQGFSRNGTPFDDAIYLADAMEPALTEVGRLAYLEHCVRSPSLAIEDDAVGFAICQGDLDAFDPARFAAQLRSDTAHPPALRMALRLRAHALTATLAQHAADVKKILATDAAYAQLWDAAAKGRATWASRFGGDTAGLALAQRLDTGFFLQSRKAFDGCEATTTAALHAAITASAPAKLFKDMHDVRDDPNLGFASKAGPVLADIPAVSFAAMPYIVCNQARGAAEFLAAYVRNTPGYRGPRSAAYTEITLTKVVLDDLSKRVMYPPWDRPFAHGRSTTSSAGGVIRAVKPGDDGALAVDLDKLLVKRRECVASHRTNRISRINRDGSLDYEAICDRVDWVTHDETWGTFQLHKDFAPALEKGAMFSSVTGTYPGGADVLAVWAGKDAAAPSMILGAPVK